MKEQPRPRLVGKILVAFLYPLLLVTGTALAQYGEPDDPNGGGSGCQTGDTIVEASNFEFTPANPTIQVGDTICFRNQGGQHNVDIEGGPTCSETCSSPDNAPSTASWTARIQFNQAGAVDYHCDAHVGLGMEGTVTVEDSGDGDDGGGDDDGGDDDGGDDDGGDTGGNPGSLSFEQDFLTPLESDPNVELRVVRSSGSDGTVSVSVATTGGDAEAGSDYMSTSRTVSWSDGETGAKSVEIGLLSDGDLEGSETFEVSLQGATGGASIQDPKRATIKILDDEGDTSPCVENETTLCLGAGDRFRVTVSWRTDQGTSGDGNAVELMPAPEDSGLFYFFDENNWEMLIKVLPGCAITDAFWVFYAATTDVEFELTVTDPQTGVVELYGNPLGHPADPVQDTQAFPVCDL
ncbi:MAG: Calx-beta domain-containing protein [Thermoanaerobaculia bacterium]|nr:Calx-beta domain-containing protein [Thermoanaerobaculia bacterium]